MAVTNWLSDNKEKDNNVHINIPKKKVKEEKLLLKPIFGNFNPIKTLGLLVVLTVGVNVVLTVSDTISKSEMLVNESGQNLNNMSTLFSGFNTLLIVTFILFIATMIWNFFRD